MRVVVKVDPHDVVEIIGKVYQVLCLIWGKGLGIRVLGLGT